MYNNASNCGEDEDQAKCKEIALIAAYKNVNLTVCLRWEQVPKASNARLV